MEQAGGLLLFIVFVVLSLLLRYLYRSAKNSQELLKRTACTYHNWKWDENIHTYRCQNKNCPKIAGLDSPPGWMPPF